MTEPAVVLPNDGSRPGTPWWIRGTQFSSAEAAEAYDLDAVLELREALAVAVESWQPVTPVILAANLTPSPGPGCDATAVNQWLGMVRAAMQEDVAAPVRPAPPVVAPVLDEPGPVELAGPPEPAAPATPAAPAAPAGRGRNAQVAQRIEDARFTPLRFRHGYVMGEVDDFLDELVAAVSADEPIAQRVQEVRFTESRMREAYLIEDVELFLAQLVRDHEGVTLARRVPVS